MVDQTHIEEKIAHLERIVEDLSDVIARQERELAVLTRKMHVLVEREVQREQEVGGGVLADQRPPHW